MKVGKIALHFLMCSAHTRKHTQTHLNAQRYLFFLNQLSCCFTPNWIRNLKQKFQIPMYCTYLANKRNNKRCCCWCCLCYTGETRKLNQNVNLIYTNRSLYIDKKMYVHTYTPNNIIGFTQLYSFYSLILNEFVCIPMLLLCCVSWCIYIVVLYIVYAMYVNMANIEMHLYVYLCVIDAL